MGQFSWLDCITGKQILNNTKADVYVLVPEKFRNAYADKGTGHIKESCYDGYGHFGMYDIYDLVADWNKDEIDAHTFQGKTFHIPKLEDYSEKEYYQKALNYYAMDKQRLIDFCNGTPDKEMIEKYGTDYKRYIGIDIACLDEDNRQLKYPIKLTHEETAEYENCTASLKEPNQGWQMDEEEEIER